MLNSENLYFFVGKSGSGKDSIMLKTAEILTQENLKIHVLKRLITRPPHPSEPFISVSEEEFLKFKEEGKFVLDWYVYGKYYGCLVELEEYLKKGYMVFVNVSRAILFNARKKYPKSKIILIEVDVKLATQRISNRSREDDKLQERKARMEIDIEIPSPDLIVKNNGVLEEPVAKVVQFIKRSLI